MTESVPAFDSTLSGMLKYPPEKGDKNMPASEAQLRANAKYRKAHERQFFLSVNDRTRPKMLEYLETLENNQGYIRHLIAVDMKAQGLETDGMDGE